MSSLAERLPSQNKSFTSAQILTVTELRQQCLDLAQRNASVRITGILVSHDVDGQFVRIVDPLISSSTSSANQRPTNPYLKEHQSNSNKQNTGYSKNSHQNKSNHLYPNNNMNHIPTSAIKRTPITTHTAIPTSISTSTASPLRTPISKSNSTTNEAPLPRPTPASTPISSTKTIPSCSVQNPYLKPPRKSSSLLGSKNKITNYTRKIVSVQKKRHTSLLERSMKQKKTLISATKSSSSSFRRNNIGGGIKLFTSPLFKSKSVTKFKPKSRLQQSTPSSSSSLSSSASSTYSKSILVDVSSVSTSSIKLGDLIMVLGEMQCLLFSFRHCTNHTVNLKQDMDEEVTPTDWNINGTKSHEKQQLLHSPQTENSWRFEGYDHSNGTLDKPTPQLTQAVLASAQLVSMNNDEKNHPNNTNHNHNQNNEGRRSDEATQGDIGSDSGVNNPSSTSFHSSVSYPHPITKDPNSRSTSTLMSASTSQCINEEHKWKKGGYLAARIVQNVNGTDMHLFHQALLLRRKYYNR